MYALIVFLPLIAAGIAGFGGRWLGDKGSQLITCVLVAATAILAWWAFIQVMEGSSPQIIDLMSWINSGNLHVGWTLRVDQITAVMLVVVCTVSAMVHLYSCPLYTSLIAFLYA